MRGHNKIVQHMYTCYSATLESSLDLVGDSDCLVGDSDFLGSSFFWVFFSLSSLFSSSFASFFCSCFGSCLVCSFSSVLSSSMLSSFSRDSDLFFWERLSSLDLLLSWINKHSFEWFKTSYRFINLWIYKILYKLIKIRILLRHWRFFHDINIKCWFIAKIRVKLKEKWTIMFIFIPLPSLGAVSDVLIDLPSSSTSPWGSDWCCQ